jgi:arabinan endo-1,5-alpha-L-arabinosidase
MPVFRSILLCLCVPVVSVSSANAATEGPPRPAPATVIDVTRQFEGAAPLSTRKLADFRMRDACVFVDEKERRYVMVAAGDGDTVRAYTSTDLVQWTGPHIVFAADAATWKGADLRGIWAPELHAYRGRYYLFLTYNTATPLSEQWRNWLPRVKRASSVLVADSPLGPFRPFSDKPTLPEDMMTLDGTLWVEDGVPWMVYCHEWVQIVVGTIAKVRLADDLSATVGEPTRLFFANDAPWAKRNDQYGCYVTDGPWLHRSKTGKLLMLWSGFGAGGYTVAVAESQSGKLPGPWVQQPEPVFTGHGGHPMLFRRFDGQLMMALHRPNRPPDERIQLFEMEDTGDTVRIRREFP